MKSHHAALLSMVTIMVIGACSMFYIHVHREDSAATNSYQAALESSDASTDQQETPKEERDPGHVELANYLVEASDSGRRVLLVLGDSQQLNEQIVFQLGKETRGEKPHVYALQIVEPGSPEAEPKQTEELQVTSQNAVPETTKHTRPCGLVSMRAR